ncbi:hypothetical protein [Numidum massiliense]|uniref:hypothetical protein n=1 Tax=Numidum massiliense TaxID=1522315 RepID=UPI0006D5B23A|nr:hypothetical protein [Numidum massiliense]
MREAPYAWQFDARLDLERPVLHVPDDELTEADRQAFAAMCQQVCAKIPERIKTLEQEYMERFTRLEDVEQDAEFHELLDEMNEISGCISELNVLYLQLEGKYLTSYVHA